jgi:predicted RNA-binding protein with RPS1 domain
MRYQHALAAISEVEGRGVVKGEVYRVRVLKVVDFGAYVTLPNGMPAMLHISELSHEKIREVRDVISEGEEFDVMCKGRDSKGFVQLSLKAMQPGPDGQQGGQDGAAAGGAQHSRGPAEAIQGSTFVADAAAAAAAGAPTGSLQDRLAAAMAAISSSSGTSRRANPQQHSSRQTGVAGSSGSSNKLRQAPRAMTWRPPPEQQEQQQQGQAQGQQESGKAQEQ